MIHLLLLLALAGCKPAVTAVEGGVMGRGPTPRARLQAGLGSLGSAEPHADILRAMDHAAGKVACDLPDRLEGTGKGVELVRLDQVVSSDLLWGRDERALAQALRSAGVVQVLLRRDVEPSVDRGRLIVERLYHDDFRSFFELEGVDRRFVLYRVLEKPLVFPPAMAAVAVRQLRSMIKGEKVPRLPDLETEDGRRWNLLAVVRPQGGRELAIGHCLRDSFQECLFELSRDLEREHRRNVEWYGLPRLADQVDELVLEVHRITDRGPVLTRDDDDLQDIFEMGIDGAVIIDHDVDRAAVFPGEVSYTRSYRDIDTFLRHAAMDFRLGSRRPWHDPANELDKIRTIGFMDVPGTGLLPIFRGVPPVPMQAVDLQAIREAVLRSAGWYLANLQPNGQVTYKFWPSENRYSDEYNLVRHTLATLNLVQAWHVEPRPEFLQGARRALDWTLSHRVDEGDMSFLEFNDNRKLGSVVVGLLGMVELAQATGDHQWDDLMLRFGRFVLFMQEDSGRFRPYYVPPDHPYANEQNDIVPGEAALALVRLSEYTGDRSWLAPLPRFFDYYLPWWKERVQRRDDQAPWPAYLYPDQTRLDLVQFGPWSVMAANACDRVSCDPRARDFGLEVARWMIQSYQWNEDRAPWPDYIGGYYKIPHELPAMQGFVYAEGTAAAYDLAVRSSPDDVRFFEEATRESMRFALNMQYDQDQVLPFSRGDEVLGGIRYALNETKVRIDYVHHALSAMVQYLQAAQADPGLPDSVAGGSADQRQ